MRNENRVSTTLLTAVAIAVTIWATMGGPAPSHPRKTAEHMANRH